MDKKKKFAIIPLVFIGLILGILSGLYRIGWVDISVDYAGQHGALMVGGFLGSLICLERAVTVKHSLAFLIPFINVLSVPLFFAGAYVAAQLALIVGSCGLIVLFIHFYKKTGELYHIIMLIGAICWLTGNILLLVSNLYPVVSTWWIGFLFLTIAGERLELTKFLPVSRLKRSALLSAVSIFLLGLVLPFHIYGKYFLSAGLIIAALWLLKFDMAGKSLKRPGLSRFSGAALICGYVWLLISGALFMRGEMSGYLYDAALHTFFIGFVFSMIFGHGPIILPGVAGIAQKPFHPTLYIWLVALQASVAVRLGADLTLNVDLRQWSGLLNGLIILGFFINLAIVVRLSLGKSKINGQ